MASVMKVMKAMKVAQMDVANRSLCYALRNPPGDAEKMKYKDIRKHVKKVDGKRPSIGAIAEAASTFHALKESVGRPMGWRKTTKAEDLKILATFKKERPPGYGIDSRRIHKALPKKLQQKVCRRTVRERLAEKGITPQMKLNKLDFKEGQIRKRLSFQREHDGKTAATWKSEVQGVGDFKEFTFYPIHLRAKFLRIRAPWTYMTNAERRKPEFQRPKRWFPSKEWKQVRKQKVFGLTTSNGKSLYFIVPKPFTSSDWAKEMKNRVVPFLKRCFPNKRSFQVLLDGESLFYAPESKRAMDECCVSVLPNWPKYSPDLNPQENVWGWAEERLREIEKDSDTFEVFQNRVLDACRAYPFSAKLVGSMAKRMRLLKEKSGASIGK